MIPVNTLKVGDIVLFERKSKITEWEINQIAPSGNYFEIENDDWQPRWVYRGEILEIMRSEGGVDITITERPAVIESKFK